jgi:short-subunit dehydrogenase
VPALTDRHVLITGASSGIGAELATMLAGLGARLTLVARNAARLESIARVCGGRPAPAVRAVDLGDVAALRACAAEIRRQGAVDVLIHSAGTVRLGPFATLDVASFDEQYAINVRAPFVLTQELLPAIVAARGQVVFLNSSAGLMARAAVSQYGATKHALKAVADSLRDEVHAAGVRVISVYPGRVATPMQEQVCAQEGIRFEPERYLQPRDVAQVIVSALTLAESAEIKDISLRPMLA